MLRCHPAVQLTPVAPWVVRAEQVRENKKNVGGGGIRREGRKKSVYDGFGGEPALPAPPAAGRGGGISRQNRPGSAYDGFKEPPLPAVPGGSEPPLPPVPGRSTSEPPLPPVPGRGGIQRGNRGGSVLRGFDEHAHSEL